MSAVRTRPPERNSPPSCAPLGLRVDEPAASEPDFCRFSAMSASSFRHEVKIDCDNGGHWQRKVRESAPAPTGMPRVYPGRSVVSSNIQAILFQEVYEISEVLARREMTAAPALHGPTKGAP